MCCVTNDMLACFEICEKIITNLNRMDLPYKSLDYILSFIILKYHQCSELVV